MRLLSWYRQSVLTETSCIIPLGGWVTSNVPAHKVWVRNALGEYIPGIVASKPPHYMTEAGAQGSAGIRKHYGRCGRSV